MPPLLRLSRNKGIVCVELLGENSYPRLSTALLRQLDAAFSEFFADPSCRAAVLHGSEKAFAAGADIEELVGLDAVAALDFARRAQLLFEALARSPKPIVAAIRGYCLGGGLDLALACHWRLATPEAVFGHPGATLGLLTGWGGTQRLPRLVGREQALELLLLGEPIDAQRALAIGLVQEIVSNEQLLSRARDRALALEAKR